LINNFADLGLFLQVGGILLGLSTTRYLFYWGIIVWYLLGKMRDVVPTIDFGHPPGSEFWLMYKIYRKIWMLEFKKYLHHLLNNENKEPQKIVSKVVMFVGVLIIIIGTMFHHSYFNPHPPTIIFNF
jgi:hypothetical protein